MTKLEFEKLQLRHKASGMKLKPFLQSEGVAYSSYNYWSRKIKEESAALPIAPIEIRHTAQGFPQETTLSEVDVAGVTMAFTNGVRAHFGSGSERVLMDVLCKSMGHVLPQ